MSEPKANRTMTVARFIEALSALPPDAELRIPINCMCCGRDDDYIEEIEYEGVAEGMETILLDSGGLHGSRRATITLRAPE